MISNTAWQRHGCYTLGSDQYFNMPLGKAILGCQDDWNSRKRHGLPPRLVTP